MLVSGHVRTACGVTTPNMVYRVLCVQYLHLQRDSGVSKVITNSIRLHMYKETPNNDMDTLDKNLYVFHPLVKWHPTRVYTSLGDVLTQATV